jgi:polar amino acid transport system permease protein
LKTRTEAVGAWYRDQTRLSLAAGIAGGLSVAVVIVGSMVLFIANGLVPHERILETARGDAETTVLWLGIALGVAAIAVGFGTYKVMPTKAARETAISGAALGIQAVLLAALFLFFRVGEKFPILVKQNFSFDILGDFGREFVTGARNTVILAAGGEFFGIVLGLFLAMLILSRRAVVRAPARTYINFFRGTPLVWQFSFIFAAIVLAARLPVTVYQVGILVLGLNAGAYSAEIFRAGIQSIERGQIEAARSLGMSYLQAMRYVLLPQAFRRVIPPLTNEFVILIKDTSLIFVLGLTAGQRELFGIGRDAYSETFNATPYIGSVIGYLVITLPMIWVVTRLERRLRSGLTGIVGM